MSKFFLLKVRAAVKFRILQGSKRLLRRVHMTLFDILRIAFFSTSVAVPFKIPNAAIVKPPDSRDRHFRVLLVFLLDFLLQ